MNEKEIENYFRWVVELNHGKTWKFTSPQNRGVSDRIACFPNGDVYFVELKRFGGKRSALQYIFAEDMKNLNQKYKLFSTIAEIDTWASTLKKK